ncbi:MAG: hypothetical protein AAF529_05580 [Pseudomonadota bacterium]
MSAEVLPHDPPEQIGEDLFVVKGCVKPSAIVRFTRNMAVVRDGDQLTLINPVRMDEPGLAELDALGTVQHVLRLGPFHGMDDEFYVQRYDAKFWSFTGGTTYTTPTIDHPLEDGGTLPFGNAELLGFSYMNETEGVILLHRQGGNILLTCDGIQSYSTAPHTPHTNAFTRFMMPFIGFPKRTIVGPVWVKLLVADKAGMHREMQRLLQWDFDQLLAAHGTFLASGAHADVTAAVEKMFGSN